MINLIKIFLDYRVRSDESFCFKDTSCPGIDIKELRRFATQKERSRKPVEKPQVNNNNVNTAVITLLATLIDPKSDNPGNVAKTHREYIEKVIDAPGSINAFDMAGDDIIFTAMRGNDLVEIYRLKDGKEERLVIISI